MRIEPVNNRSLSGTDGVGEQAPVRQTERAGRSQTYGPNATSTPSGDTVEISAEARVKARALEAVEAAPDTRPERVAQIRQQIQDGTYNVSPEQIADKMLGGPGQ
jgi:negative regulator of flagellin synthesis FlgM